jgi:hypothetical protein
MSVDLTDDPLAVMQLLICPTAQDLAIAQQCIKRLSEENDAKEAVLKKIRFEANDAGIFYATELELMKQLIDDVLGDNNE